MISPYPATIRRAHALTCLGAAGLLLTCAVGSADERRTHWPAIVLELPDSVPAVFIAETGAAIIRRFDRTPEGIVAGYDAYMSIGENGAGKRRAWDRKSPLGIYFVVDRLDTSRLHDKYGVMAFPLDYPNTLDRLLERTGDGIWVHGVLPDGGKRPSLDTDGCLALPNDDLAALAASLVPNQTPVIVTRAIAWRKNDEREALVRLLRRSLDRWELAQESRHADRYLALYSPAFEYRGLKLDDWATLRTAALERHRTISIEVDDLLLLADPIEEDLYLARFRHTVTADDNTTVTTKRLYWQRQDDGSLRIIAEDNG